MSSKSDDVIMILPTKNRQIYLDRVNDFYNSTELKLVILDSTTKKYEGIISKGIDYLHLPNHDVIEKFKLSLESIPNKSLKFSLACSTVVISLLKFSVFKFRSRTIFGI